MLERFQDSPKILTLQHDETVPFGWMTSQHHSPESVPLVFLMDRVKSYTSLLQSPLICTTQRQPQLTQAYRINTTIYHVESTKMSLPSRTTCIDH